MNIYALVGKSGTGKSFQAMNLCHHRGFESIIDDGLFICNSVIQAGISAKRQPTKIGATKTALFTQDSHRLEVKNKIIEMNPNNILVLGTSVGMIDKIVNKLQLPYPTEFIDINDITTVNDRKKAEKQRNELGKHVIPVPTVELKKQFSGYFLDPFNVFRPKEKTSINEKTVVRPTYSYLGDYSISNKVILDIVTHIANHHQAIDSVIKIGTAKHQDGIKIKAVLVFKSRSNIMNSAKTFQAAVIKEVENMTALNIVAMNVEIKGLK